MKSLMKYNNLYHDIPPSLGFEVSSEMTEELCLQSCVYVVCTDVSEEPAASVFRVEQ
jgi:hypothetical protein